MSAENRVVDLMEALERSVAEARAAREKLGAERCVRRMDDGWRPQMVDDGLCWVRGGVVESMTAAERIAHLASGRRLAEPPASVRRPMSRSEDGS